MITLWSRLNAVFFYAVTVLVFCGLGTWVTTLWMESRPIIAQLRINKLLTLRPQQERIRKPDLQDRAIFTFDLDADLSSVFNWNVKQLFVYVSASYSTQRNGTNEVVVWDKVVNSSSAAVLKYVNEFNKYPLVDRRQELRNAQITLSLSWDIMPITGLLSRRSRQFALLQLPRSYCLDREANGASGKAPLDPNLLTECEVLSLPLPAKAKRKAGGGAKEKTASSWADSEF